MPKFPLEPTRRSRPVAVRFGPRADRALSRLAEVWECSRADAVRRAVAEAAARATSEKLEELKTDQHEAKREKRRAARAARPPRKAPRTILEQLEPKPKPEPKRRPPTLLEQLDRAGLGAQPSGLAPGQLGRRVSGGGVLAAVRADKRDELLEELGRVVFRISDAQGSIREMRRRKGNEERIWEMEEMIEPLEARKGALQAELDRLEQAEELER